MKSFIRIPAESDVTITQKIDALSFLIERRNNLKNLVLKENQMHFCYVQSGQFEFERHDKRSMLRVGEGMYFALDSTWNYGDGQGSVLSIVCTGYTGLNSIGGPIEATGRLRYIDTCTDSLLIPPTKWGDPCLNLLVFPPGIVQTPHFHPSFRAGMVVSGSGCCVLDDGEKALQPGDFFFIPENLRHSFNSDAKLGLRVIAFHPDSDFGPTDEVHPMINRTLFSRDLPTNESKS